MCIFTNPPVTILLSDVKVGPKINLINYAYLAVWERKYLHSPKAWECVRNPNNQTNRDMLIHLGLKQQVPAEGQSVDIVTQVVLHGNLSSGTHPGRNVPDDGFFYFGVNAIGHVSLPLLLKHTWLPQKTPPSHGGGVYIQILEIAFQSTL